MLAGEKVYVSVRGSSLRVTPHGCNSVENCERLIACLSRIAVAKENFEKWFSKGIPMGQQPNGRKQGAKGA
jgi:hypothetical protein